MKTLVALTAISLCFCGAVWAQESVPDVAPTKEAASIQSTEPASVQSTEPASGTGLLPMPPAPPPLVSPFSEGAAVQLAPTIAPASTTPPAVVSSAPKPASSVPKPAASTVAKPTLNTALKAFNDRNFGGALAQFDQLDRQGMCNEKVHYYMARCCQQLSQVARALDNYSWVISYGKDPTLKYYAQVASSQIGRYSQHRTYAGNGNVFVASGRGGGGGG